MSKDCSILCRLGGGVGRAAQLGRRGAAGISSAARRAAGAVSDSLDAIGRVDYGTIAAGVTNQVMGVNKITAGVAAFIAGGVASTTLVGVVPITGPAWAIGSYEVGTGTAKLVRSHRQLYKDHACRAECNVWGNVKRFVDGVTPFGDDKDLIDRIGGLP